MIPEKKLKLEESRIKSQCPECQGRGCKKCQAQINRRKIYASANIPVSYWDLAFKDFQGDPKFKVLISENISQLDKLYQSGQSFAFVGRYGTGKTYAACCLLKAALVAGYSARYYNMSEVINEIIHDDGSFMKELLSVDFLCVDEYDGRWVFPSEKSEQLFGQNLEHILRNRFQNLLPTIVCSNTPEIKDVLAGDFAEAMDSLFAQYMSVINVAGKDFRKS